MNLLDTFSAGGIQKVGQFKKATFAFRLGPSCNNFNNFIDLDKTKNNLLTIVK